MQSERFYQALKGHGVPSRLVILPHESHGYRARENVLHCLYEQDQWFERYAGFGRLDTDYDAEGNEAEVSGSTSD
jgi:dipeptidyl aminopeptidase/acylaminoacyl peptidase